MIMISLCSLKQPKEVYEAVQKVIDSGRYVKGPLVEQFEKEWAKRCGKNYAVAVGSGAQALELAIDAIFEPEAFVSTQSYAYKAVGNAIRRMGRKFYVRDEKPEIFTHHHHEAHLDYEPILEDCSHAHGYKPVAGTAIFSFFPTKILGAIGEAGIIVTNNVLIYEECLFKRSHELPRGTNARMDEIQAAVLLAKLPYLDEWNKRRLEIVKEYDKAFGQKTLGKFHYVYTIPGSEEKAEKLKHMGIETAFYYRPDEMAIPLHPYLTNEEVREVIRCVQVL